MVEGLIRIGHILRSCARMFLVYFHATLQPKIYYFFLTEVHRATATYLKQFIYSNLSKNVQVRFEHTVCGVSYRN